MSVFLSTVIGFLIQLLEAAGVAVILGAFIAATAGWLRRMRQQDSHSAYLAYRRRSVRGLILGLEFLVAADIIRSVAIDHTLQAMLMLGLIVLIRTFLVFALHLEIEGRLPWNAPGEDEGPVKRG